MKRLEPIIQFFKKFWAIIFAVILSGIASYEVVNAQPQTYKPDQCTEIIAYCEKAVLASSVDATKFDDADKLAVTNYSKYITYKIVFQGELEPTTDSEQFINQVKDTFYDERGWARAGYIFNRVQQTSVADFVLILVQAEILDTIPGCDSSWSCRSGINVYINEDRWNNATSAWNMAGGSIRDYRHMVVNHEVGHWLGLGHLNCSDSPNNFAPVMQQQSIGLQGCQFNPWPLQLEIDLVT